MIEDQNNRCAICNEEGFKLDSNTYHKLNVDHNHKTGKVRGLLCHNCNRALGLLKDDVQRFKTAISYLESST